MAAKAWRATAREEIPTAPTRGCGWGMSPIAALDGDAVNAVMEEKSVGNRESIARLYEKW